jgi:hypothetical protein
MSALAIRGGSGLLRAVAGWLVWALCFAVLYSLQGLGCHTDWTLPAVGPFSGLSLLLATVWLLHAGTIAGLEWRAARAAGRSDDDRDRFLLKLTRIANWTSFAAVLWIGAPILFLSPCA